MKQSTLRFVSGMTGSIWISSRASATLGKLTPLYVGSTSHVILAALPDEQMAAYIDTTEFVPPFPGAKVDAPILRRAIAEVRRNGYAETHNKRFDEGASISAVVRSSGAEMTGALTVSIAIGQYTSAVRARTIEVVTIAALALSVQLAWISHPRAVQVGERGHYRAFEWWCTIRFARYRTRLAERASDGLRFPVMRSPPGRATALPVPRRRLRMASPITGSSFASHDVCVASRSMTRPTGSAGRTTNSATSSAADPVTTNTLLRPVDAITASSTLVSRWAPQNGARRDRTLVPA